MTPTQTGGATEFYTPIDNVNFYHQTLNNEFSQWLVEVDDSTELHSSFY